MWGGINMEERDRIVDVLFFGFLPFLFAVTYYNLFGF